MGAVMSDLIDYNDSTDIAEVHWTASHFKNYWSETFWKIHKTGGAAPWGIKEATLLKKVIGEFNKESLADMILYWHVNTPKSSVASRFDNFYSQRFAIFDKVRKATRDYSWE